MNSYKCVLTCLLVAGTASLYAHSSNTTDEGVELVPPVPEQDKNAFDATVPVDAAVRINVTAKSHSLAWRSEFLNKSVQAEGIAWGRALGQRVIMDRSQVRITGLDFADEDSGKLVRVKGTLKYHPAVGTRFGTRKAYFFVQAESYTVIKQVTCPGLKGIDENVRRIQAKLK